VVEVRKDQFIPNHVGQITYYDMTWSQESMICMLLKNINSYSLEFKCECGYSKTKNYDIFYLNSFNKKDAFSEQVQSRMQNRKNESKAKCTNCKKRMTNSEIKPNELLIVDCSFPDSTNRIQTKIQLKDIPRMVTINNLHYDLIFTVNWVDFNHFNTFVWNREYYIHFDDIGQKNFKILKDDFDLYTINPNVLLFHLNGSSSD
jgi:hypothetical protein